MRPSVMRRSRRTSPSELAGPSSSGRSAVGTRASRSQKSPECGGSIQVLLIGFFQTVAAAEIRQGLCQLIFIPSHLLREAQNPVLGGGFDRGGALAGPLSRG